MPTCTNKNEFDWQLSEYRPSVNYCERPKDLQSNPILVRKIHHGDSHGHWLDRRRRAVWVLRFHGSLWCGNVETIQFCGRPMCWASKDGHLQSKTIQSLSRSRKRILGLGAVGDEIDLRDNAEWGAGDGNTRQWSLGTYLRWNDSRYESI